MTEAHIKFCHQTIAELTADKAPFALTNRPPEAGGGRAYAHAPKSVSDIYRMAEESFADRLLIAEGDRSLSVAEAMTAARRFGAVLQDHYGVHPGDRVGLISRNRPEWFIAFFAITMIGGVAVLFNSRAPAEEFSFTAADKDCKAIIADVRRAEIVRQAGMDLPIITITDPDDAVAETDFAALIASSSREAQVESVDANAPAAILFSSGTTGRPKGAVLSHNNLCHMTYNGQFMGALGMAMTAQAYGVPVETLRGMAPPMATVLILPMFHVSGLNSLFMCLQAGGLLVTMPRWNAVEAMDLIERHRVNFMTGPALVLTDLFDLPNAAERLAGLGNVGVAGQSTPANLSARIKELLPRTQRGNGYGMTELSGSVSAASGVLFEAKPGSCGIVSPVMDLCAISTDGQPLARGEVGELAVRGALVMSGYWNAPEETAASYRNGWFLTGDIGFVDADGFVFLVDRKKDMVISAGENIYCAEVERVLSGHDGVREVALFGVDDERFGERAIAAVTLRQGFDASAEELQALVRAHLADYKVPGEVRLDLGPLPRNTLDKVDKTALRALYLATVEGVT